MKIFRVKKNSNHVQLVNLTKDRESSFLQFNCEPKFHEWKDTEVYIYNPKVKPKNFYGLISGILVFDQKVLEVCQTVFEKAGEIIPIQVERGSKLYILNVLNCINGLDYDRTVWDYYDDGTKGRILEYKFHENRIVNESTIFKIPETCATSIFCFTDERDEDDQFYHLYHKHKLTGLIFEEIDNS